MSNTLQENEFRFSDELKNLKKLEKKLNFQENNILKNSNSKWKGQIFNNERKYLYHAH